MHGYELKRELSPALPARAARERRRAVSVAATHGGGGPRAQARRTRRRAGGTATSSTRPPEDGASSSAGCAAPTTRPTRSTYDFLVGHPFLTKSLFFARLDAGRGRAASSSAQLADSTAQARRRSRRSGRAWSRRDVDPYRIAVLDLGIAQQKERVRWLKRMINHATRGGGRHERTTRAIDMWAPIVPVPEVMEHVAQHFPKEMAGYLRVFYKREPDPARVRAGDGRHDDGRRDGDRGARPGGHRADADHRLRRVLERARDVHPERAGRRPGRAPSRPLHPVRRARTC